MSEASESKRLWRTALIVAGAGLLVLVPLLWFAVRMYNDNLQRKLIAANEAAALVALENIQAAEQLYLEAHGSYGTFPQLVEAGVFQAASGGEVLVSKGYTFSVKVTPRSESQGPTYSVNADPIRDQGRDSTGRRHFYISSEITGVRISEGRPANASDKPRQTVQE